MIILYHSLRYLSIDFIYKHIVVYDIYFVHIYERRVFMPRSEAQKKADRKYHAKTYKPFTINAKITDYDLIHSYCETKGISKAKLLIEAAKYVIKNDIDL